MQYPNEITVENLILPIIPDGSHESLGPHSYQPWIKYHIMTIGRVPP